MGLHYIATYRYMFSCLHRVNDIGCTYELVRTTCTAAAIPKLLLLHVCFLAGFFLEDLQCTAAPFLLLSLSLAVTDYNVIEFICCAA